MRSCQPKACTTDTLQVTVFVFLWVFSKKKKKKKMKQIRTKDILRFCFPLLQQFLCLSSLVCFPLQATLRLSSLLLLPITGTSVPFDTLPFALHREVAKAVKLRKAKTVVVAPNIEQIESEGGLDDLLGSILKQAEDFGLPVVFALSRKKMGQVWVSPRAGCLACSILNPWS